MFLSIYNLGDVGISSNLVVRYLWLKWTMHTSREVDNLQSETIPVLPY